MRKKMIREGLLADPDKPTTLENAITIVGTCEDMCPLHERVERIVQQMVDKCEKVRSDMIECSWLLLRVPARSYPQRPVKMCHMRIIW
jgi:hypothetical protein